MLVLLLLSGALGAPAVAKPTMALPERSAAVVHVRVTRGRGALVRGEEVEILTTGPAAQPAPGPALFELGPGAEAEVLWPTRASLRVTGPASLSWRGGDELEVVLERFRSIEVEVRRKTFILELPHGWSLEARPAAFGLAERTSGVSVRHHGGQALRVRSRVPRRRTDWPRWIGPGPPVRLGVISWGVGHRGGPASRASTEVQSRAAVATSLAARTPHRSAPAGASA